MTDILVGVAIFAGFIVVGVAIAMLFGSFPKSVKDFLMDNLGWIFFGTIILLLIWENA